MRIPDELIEQVTGSKCVLFVGAGISLSTRGQRGLPSANQLAREMAVRCNYVESDLTLPRVAQYYEMRKGWSSLVEFISNKITDPQIVPLTTHKLIALLPLPIVITTNWDRLLERAFEEAHRSYRLVVRNEEISYLDPDKVTLLKIHGSIEQPDTLVITEDNYLDFFNQLPTISTVLKAEFATKPLLFIGYSLEDSNFKRLYTDVTREVHRHKRRAYAVQRNPSEFAIEWWHRKEVEIIDADAAEFLEVLGDVGKPAAYNQTAKVYRERQPVHLISKRPYKALNYFYPEDEAMFFGRDEDARHLLSLIVSYNLVVLFGESGSGKTSLINAGVIPSLARAGYKIINARALEDPTVAIMREANRLLPDPITTVQGHLVVFLRQVADLLEASVINSSLPMQGIVIILDQFEEFFIRLSPEFRNAFIEDLAGVLAAKEIPIKFVFSLRGEYLARLSEFEKRIPEVFQNKWWLRRLTREQAAEAVEGPVLPLGIRYQPELLKRLLEDSFNDGVYPPHLQILCDKLFDILRSDEKQITLTHYEKLGKAERILASYTSNVLAEFPGSLRAIARATLVELVTSVNTKAALEKPILARLVGGHSEDQIAVWDKLVNARLIRSFDKDGLTYFELAHEYLVNEITTWIDETEREVKKARELLAQETDNWRRYRMLVPRERLEILYTYREGLNFEEDGLELMARSAFSADLNPVEWTHRIVNLDVKSRVLLDAYERNISDRLTIRKTKSDGNSKVLSDAYERNSSNRLTIVSELGHIPGEIVRDALIGIALQDPTREIRWTAVEALLRIAPRRASQHFLDFIHNPTNRNPLRHRFHPHQALVVLWEGGSAMSAVTYVDWVWLAFVALVMNLSGRNGQIRQFVIFSFLAGILGGTIAGTWNGFVTGSYSQIWMEIWNRAILAIDTISSWSVVEGIDRILQTPEQVLSETWLYLLFGLLILYAPIIWFGSAIKSWKAQFRANPNKSKMRIVGASVTRFAASIIFFGYLVLNGGYIIFEILLCFAVAVSVALAIMWKPFGGKLPSSVLGPVIGAICIQLLYGLFVVINFVYLAISGNNPSLEMISITPGDFELPALGLAIGVGITLPLTISRWPISSLWVWQTLCRCVGRSDLVMTAFSQVPRLSLVGLIASFLISILTPAIFREQLWGMVFIAFLTFALTLTLGMACALPPETRKDLTLLKKSERPTTRK